MGEKNQVLPKLIKQLDYSTRTYWILGDYDHLGATRLVGYFLRVTQTPRPSLETQELIVEERKSIRSGEKPENDLPSPQYQLLGPRGCFNDRPAFDIR